jgi:hypothetical protein
MTMHDSGLESKTAGDALKQPEAATSDPTLPCPYRQATMLQQALSPDKMRVAFFLGAGCPLAIRVPNQEGPPKPIIPDIKGLTEEIRNTVGADLAHRDHFDVILRLLCDSQADRKTVEHILSRVRGLLDVISTGTFEGLDAPALRGLDEAICKKINAVMRKRLPSRNTPYHQLATWIASIPRTHPVEIFTTNYDLLMEQALEENSVPYFDGFSGSDRTFFDVPSMEQLALPPRWARLWKLHGSINWWKTKEGEIQRREQGEEGQLQMIHPSHIKYSESRKMPYLAMQDRLRSFLARGQAVLVTCGFSFLDEHLNQAILDGLGGNPSAVCYGLLWGDREKASEAVAKVGHRGNLRLLGADGGVLGTVSREWHAKPDIENALHGKAVCDGDLSGDRTNAPGERCKFLLGDFESFGKFLADQVANRGWDEEVDNAT